MNLLFYPLVLIAILVVSPSWAFNLTRLGLSNYYVSSSELSFVEAQFLCQQQGMELVSFENEQEFVQFNTTMDALQIDNTISYWIGGLRLKNGLWYWTSSKSMFTYNEWGTNEPTCSAHSVCGVVLGKLDNRNYMEPRKWCAEPVTAEFLYICES